MQSMSHSLFDYLVFQVYSIKYIELMQAPVVSHTKVAYRGYKTATST